jgi:membrane-associated protease RseP (regulator of RpoE activity)
VFRNVLFAALVGLGLTTWGATESFAQGVPRPLLRSGGLSVTGVLPGTTAALQGIEPGDVIVGVNGNPVQNLADLNVLIALAGQVAQLDVIDCRTGWQNPILVYPHNGLIGVMGQSAAGNVQPIPPIYPPWGRPIRPIPPIYPPVCPPWHPGGRPIPLPLPVNPGYPGGQPIPLPLPVNPGYPGGQPIPLPLPIPGR